MVLRRKYTSEPGLRPLRPVSGTKAIESYKGSRDRNTLDLACRDRMPVGNRSQ
jgi:hypothetical protein